MTEEIKAKLESHEQKLDSQEQRIAHTESITVPLLTKMDSLVNSLAENTKEVAIWNVNQKHTNDSLARMHKRQDLAEIKTQSNTDTLNQNKNSLLIMNKLPLYLATTAITVLGMCGILIYSLIMK